MRSHYCGDLNLSHVGQSVTLCGWAYRRRDHGGVDLLKLNKGDGHHAFMFAPPAGSYQPPLQLEIRAAKRKVLKAVTVEPPAVTAEPAMDAEAE